MVTVCGESFAEKVEFEGGSNPIFSMRFVAVNGTVALNAT